jgi:peroxiredoxin
MDASVNPLTQFLQPGAAAPDFSLPSVQGDRIISLADYRGSSALLLGLFPGVFCPFCRRSLAHMAESAEKLKPLGVESLAVIGTAVENARLYYRFRPTRLTLAADPTLDTHQSYGVPHPEPVPALVDAVMSTHINPFGELPKPMPVPEAAEAQAKLDGYQPSERDAADSEWQLTQMKGQFLIDAHGIVQWSNVECGREGLSGLGKFPTTEELLHAVRETGTGFRAVR